MKDKIVKLITNKWVHGIISFILTLLIILQEVLLSNPICVWYGLIFSALFGVVAEAIRIIIQRQKYNILNVLPWLIGGALACLIMMFV